MRSVSGHSQAGFPVQSALYGFLLHLPLPEVTTLVVTLLAVVFFVTSGDSASLVLANYTLKPGAAQADGPVWLRVFWAAVIGALTLALLLAGGLQTLQSAVVIMALPFSVVLLLMAWGLYRGLRTQSLATTRREPRPPGEIRP